MRKPARLQLSIATVVLSTIVVLPATGQTINEDLKLTAFDGAAFDIFGESIAIDNGIVAVGSPFDDDNGMGSGSAYLYNASTGMLLYKLLPNDGAGETLFGWSIAIDNNIVAVGASRDRDNGNNSGSAYLFDATTGAQLFKILPKDGAAGDYFGQSIAIDNGVVAVGADFDDDNGSRSGSAYLFDASTGAQLFKLLANDGTTEDRFGHSIAIFNGIVAVGAYKDDDNGSQSGSAYLFDDSTGAQLFKLLPSDGARDGYFGNTIAINDGVVAIGARREDDLSNDSGSAYLFDSSTGTQLFKLLPNDGPGGEDFGNSIAIDNGFVAVGARRDDDNGSQSGSAYLFDASTGAQVAKLFPSEAARDDRFGFSIDIDNGIVVVGATGDDDNGENSGSAYVYDINCYPDINNDGVLDFFDISAFLKAFSAMDPAADFTGEGVFDFFDISAFLEAFSAGCP